MKPGFWGYVDSLRAGFFSNLYTLGSTLKYLTGAAAGFSGFDILTGDFFVETAPAGSQDATATTTEQLRLLQSTGELKVAALRLPSTAALKLSNILIGQVLITGAPVTAGEYPQTCTVSGVNTSDATHFHSCHVYPVDSGTGAPIDPGTNILFGSERVSAAGQVTFKIVALANTTLNTAVWDVIVFEFTT